MKSLVFQKSFVIGLLYFYLLSFMAIINAQTNTDSKKQTENNVSVTINKNTTDDDFESIKAMLLENGIEAKFSNVERNANDEITGLQIELTSKHSNTSSSIFSNQPINELSFGSKNGSLYIGNKNGVMNRYAFSSGSNFDFPFLNDSIFGNRLRAFNFDDFFSGNSNIFMFNGDSLDINALKDKFLNQLNQNQGKGKQKSNNYNFPGGSEKDYYEYNFIDDPNKDTLIVINGEISDFTTLDQLAKANKLKSVDVLKPDTAMSIYGKKAKDGAIIATTH